MKPRFAVKIFAHVASLVSLLAVAAVVVALRSQVADGQSDLRMSRADGEQQGVVDAQGNLHVPSNYRVGGPWPRKMTTGELAAVIHCYPTQMEVIQRAPAEAAG